MKTIFYSFLRALCAIAVGALLVKYREEMVQWITVVIGILFFLSGLFAVVMYLVHRSAAEKAKNKLKTSMQEHGLTDDREAERTATVCSISQPSVGAAIAGVGSMVLGVILAFMPVTFVSFLVYILAIFLVFGAVQQFFTLAMARNDAPVGFWYWVMPSLLLVAGVGMLFNPMETLALPLQIIGYCMMLYGVIECIDAFKARSCRKKKERFFNLNQKPDFSDAEEVEVIEEN